MKALSLPIIVLASLGSISSLLVAEQQVFVSSASDLSLKSGTASSPALTALLMNKNVWGVCYNSVDDSLYLTDPTGDDITQINLTSNVVSTLVTQAGAVFHGIDAADGSLYVLRSGSDDIVRYDLPSTNPNVLATGFVRPNDIVVDAPRNRMFVTDSGLDQVFEYDLAGVLIRQWPLSGAWGVALSPVDGAVYVSRYDSGELWCNVLGTTTFSRVANGLDGPRGVEVDRTGDVYVLEANLNRLTEVDVISGVGTATSYVPALNGHAMVVQESRDRDGDYLGDDWEITHFGSLTVSDGTGNGDSDANDDLLEYAFMGDPQMPEESLIQNYIQNGTEGFALDLPVVNDPGLRISFLVSNNLTNWVSATPISQAAIVDTNYVQHEFNFLESSYFIPTEGRLFFKATVEPNH